MEKAVAYIRVSSQRQVEEGSSLDVQTRQVEQYAESHGNNLVRIFREEGESAKTDQRPRLQEMLQFCKETKYGVKVVIVPKIDRLARNVYDYTNLKLHLRRLGIRLESLGEHIEDSPVGRFTETILASVAQFDNEIRAERSKSGMVEAVSQGRWVWRPPVGFRSARYHGKGTIEPDPVIEPIVREVFRLMAYGAANASTARSLLKAAGINRSESSFYRMLQNEVYIGRINAFGKVYKARPPFVPLVDELTFHKAQEALKLSNVPSTYHRNSEDFVLRGSLLCSCGKPLTGSWSRGRHGSRYAYYRCRYCSGPSHSRSMVESWFASFLGGFRGREDAWDQLSTKLIALDQEIKDQQVAQRLTLLKRIEEITELRDAVALKNAAGVVPDDVAHRQIDRLGQELAQLSGTLPELSAECTKELLAFAKRFFFELKDAWHDFTLQTKKDLLRFMFPKGILFHPERGCRTPDNTLAERFQRVISGTDLHLVDPTLEFSKTLRGFIAGLASLCAKHEVVRKGSLFPATRSDQHKTSIPSECTFDRKNFAARL